VPNTYLFRWSDYLPRIARTFEASVITGQTTNFVLPVADVWSTTLTREYGLFLHYPHE